MTLTVEGVRAEHVASYWPLVGPWIASAVEHAALPWTAVDVLDRLISRDMQMWALWRADEIVGVITTELYDTPKGKTCAVPVAGGDMAAGLEAIATVEAWAREQGCVRMASEGRQGWARVLKSHGWRPVTVQIEKVL